MAQITQFLQTASLYWYVPAAAVVLLALVGYGFAYFQALRPRAGTLEWIALYDRPRFALRAQTTALAGADMLYMLGAVALCVAVRLGAQFFIYGFPMELSSQILLNLLRVYGLQAACTALSYLLLRQLYPSGVVCLLGSCLVGLNLLILPATACFAAAASLFACRFAARAEAAPFSANSLNLLLTASILTVGCYFDPALCLLAAALVLVLIVACIARFINRGKPDGYLPKTLALLLVTVALTALLIFVPAALIAGKRFPQLLFSADYYQLLAARVTAAFTGLLRFDTFGVIRGLSFDWPLLLTGLLATLAAFCGLLRRRDGQGVLLPLLLLGGVAMWLIGGAYIMPLACALGVCYVWSGLFARGKHALAAVGAAVLLATEISLYFIR